MDHYDRGKIPWAVWFILWAITPPFVWLTPISELNANLFDKL
jgi:hypothetical protein